MLTEPNDHFWNGKTTVTFFSIERESFDENSYLLEIRHISREIAQLLRLVLMNAY